MALVRAKEYVQQEERQMKVMKVVSARAVRELRTMFEDIKFHKKNMAEKVIRNKGLIGRSVPEEHEKSSPGVVDAQANNGGTKVVCVTVHTEMMAKDRPTSKFEKTIMYNYLASAWSKWA